jgi:hypothetical protein
VIEVNVDVVVGVARRARARLGGVEPLHTGRANVLETSRRVLPALSRVEGRPALSVIRTWSVDGDHNDCDHRGSEERCASIWHASNLTYNRGQ